MCGKTTFYFFVAVIVTALANAAKLRSDNEVLEEFRERNHLQQGDMYIRRPESDQKMDWDVYENWPENTIPFVISENVTQDLLPVIRTAINYIHKYTCLRFRVANVNEDEYWVRFLMHPSLVNNPKSQMMCAAIVSWQEEKDQAVFLGPRCNAPAMVHELLHTIGLYHEHNRNDRDDFIRIHPENMSEEAKGQYIKDKEWCRMQGFPKNSCTMNAHGLNYNYDSIMHYCQTCGINRQGVTVYTVLNNKQALGDPRKVGQSYGFSEGDWLLINRKYGCDPADNPQIEKPPPIPENPPTFDMDDDKIKSESSIKPSKSCKKKSL